MVQSKDETPVTADEAKPKQARTSAATAAKAEATKPAASKATASKKPATAEAEPAVPAGESEKGRALKVHHLRPAPGSRTAKIRVGRGEGGKRGKTAGRGTKGTKARYQVPAGFEGGQMPQHMRLPKLRGFTNPFRTEYQVVNLEKLAVLYPAGGSVTVEDLVAKGAVRAGRPVKVLGNGDLGGVKLDVAVDRLSATAKEKILAAGGSISQD